VFCLVFSGSFWFVPSGRERIEDARTRNEPARTRQK
jgi:hypothetical protein